MPTPDTAHRHGYADSDGVRIHYVEQGEGPVVLLVHGFPETSYSWRHQLAALAEAGYQAVAIDVRGYGRSGKPVAVEDYRMVRHVADNVAVAEHLGADKIVIAGHDWGAPIAWNSALLRPDLFDALVLLSVPYTPPSVRQPTIVFSELSPDEEFYMVYFQEPGRAEREIETDVRGWLSGFYFGASGDAPPGSGGFAFVPRGAQLRDRLPQSAGPLDWLSDEDLDCYVADFERTGLTGGLNRYRNLDRDWADLAAFRGQPITVPAVFVGGEKDGPTIWGAAAIGRFESTLPDLRHMEILPGCGHWVQQERPAEVNRIMLEFLREVRPVS